jgi:hypothetical protein
MKRHIPFIAILLLVIVTFAVGPSGASDQFPQVGVVVDLSDTSDHYLLVREEGGRKIVKQIDVLTPLYEKDVLWVSCQRKAEDQESKAISITLQLAGTEGEKELTAKNSPYVLERKSPCSIFRNFTGYLQDVARSIFAGMNEDYHRAQLTSLAVRGHDGHLFMPLIGRSGALLEAGARDLHLAWKGGCPPYALRIRAERTEKPLAEMSDLQETHVHLKGMVLETVDYVLEIEDSRGQHLIRHFQAVPSSKLPELPNKAFSEAKSKSEIQLRETIYAAWLIKQDQVLWSMEAYQRVADIAPEFHPAELLRLRLEGNL